MKQIRKRADELILIAAAIGPWTLLVVAVLIIGTLKCCLTTDSDSIDESINKSPGIVAHVMVLDSTDNGFRVVYATAAPVTDERFAEICDRPGILEGFENLKRKAPEHFGGNLLETDICDFALYAYRFPIDKKPVGVQREVTDVGFLSIRTYGYTISLSPVKRKWTSMSGTTRTCPGALHGCTTVRNKGTNI